MFVPSMFNSAASWKFSDGTPPLPTVMGCYPTEGSKILFGDFVLLMLNETSLCRLISSTIYLIDFSAVMILTLWIGIKRYRHSRNPLVVTLYRDGIFYFIYLFCAFSIQPPIGLYWSGQISDIGCQYCGACRRACTSSLKFSSLN